MKPEASAYHGLRTQPWADSSGLRTGERGSPLAVRRLFSAWIHAKGSKAMNATGKRIAVERPCRFLSVNSGRVVDVLGGSNEENAKVVQYPWHAGSNQLWNLV